MKKCFYIAIALAMLLAGCGKNEQASDSSGLQAADGESTAQGYHQISQEEAKEMMSNNDGHIIVDVRRQDGDLLAELRLGDRMHMIVNQPREHPSTAKIDSDRGRRCSRAGKSIFYIRFISNPDYMLPTDYHGLRVEHLIV